MIDAIIISLVVVAVVFVIRAHLRATLSGQCSGCPSSKGCATLSCSGDGAPACCIATEKTLRSIDESVAKAAACAPQKSDVPSCCSKHGG